MEELKVLDYSNVFIASFFTDDRQCSHPNREHTLTILDSNYPDFLKQVSCPPFVLFYEGNLKLAKNLKVGDAFIYSAFNDKRYLSTVEPSTDKGKFCFDYIIACESHDEFFNIREHVMDKKVPLKDYSKNTKHKQQER